MNNIFKIILIVVLVLIVGGSTAFLALNGDSVVQAIGSGRVLFTEKDIEEARQRGYDEGIGDRTFYESLVASLRQQIVDNRVEADRVLAQTVEHYEAEIARITAELHSKIEYIRLLEQFILDFDFNFIGAFYTLPTLELQLSVFQTIRNNLENDMQFWSAELASIPDIAPLQAELVTASAAFVSAENGYLAAKRALEVDNIIYDIVHNWRGSDARFFVNPAIGTGNLTANQILYYLREQNFPNHYESFVNYGGHHPPFWYESFYINTFNLDQFFAQNGHLVLSTATFDRYPSILFLICKMRIGLVNSSSTERIEYYTPWMSDYNARVSSFTWNQNNYNDRKATLISLQTQIETLTERRAIAEYVLGNANINLMTVNQRIVEIQALIEGLK